MRRTQQTECPSGDREAWGHSRRPTQTKRRPTIDTPGDLEEFDYAEEMEDRFPDVDPEEAEYVDYMLATGEGPIGGGSGCLLMLVVVVAFNWMSLG